MTTQEQLLWNKIQAFQLDDPHDEFTFSQRLARENGWTIGFTKRVIDEYKKFIFLCCITKSGVTPSDPVDQAWHLHLTYTKNYWVEFCRNTLEKEIHHNPTKGGKSEADKFEVFYTDTRQLYEEKFGDVQPKDIWQPNDVRFSDIYFQRVNVRKYWMVKKPSKRLLIRLFPILIGLLGSFFIQAMSIETGMLVFALLLAVIAAIIDPGKGNRGGGGNSGCGSSCSGGSHHGCGHSGCGSGCSGCSASGCSGCGGGH